jgi:hypothetical protein
MAWYMCDIFTSAFCIDSLTIVCLFALYAEGQSPFWMGKLVSLEDDTNAATNTTTLGYTHAFYAHAVIINSAHCNCK